MYKSQNTYAIQDFLRVKRLQNMGKYYTRLVQLKAKKSTRKKL